MTLTRAAVVVAVTALSYPIGLSLGSPPLLPALNAIGPFLILANCLKRQRVTEGIVLMVV